MIGEIEGKCWREDAVHALSCCNRTVEILNRRIRCDCDKGVGKLEVCLRRLIVCHFMTSKGG